MLLVLDDQETMIPVADQPGLPWGRLADNNGAAIRQVVNETPTLLIEREIALKLEGQVRPIQANDMRDMRSFTSVLPYADIVVAEKQFTGHHDGAVLEGWRQAELWRHLAAGQGGGERKDGGEGRLRRRLAEREHPARRPVPIWRGLGDLITASQAGRVSQS
jgi:hypothetical protein